MTWYSPLNGFTSSTWCGLALSRSTTPATSLGYRWVYVEGMDATDGVPRQDERA